MHPVDISNKVKDILNEKLVGIGAIGLDRRVALYRSLLEAFYQFTYDAIEFEREACAQIADSIKNERISDSDDLSNEIAKRIRERND